MARAGSIVAAHVRPFATTLQYNDFAISASALFIHCKNVGFIAGTLTYHTLDPIKGGFFETVQFLVIKRLSRVSNLYLVKRIGIVESDKSPRGEEIKFY